MNSPIVFITAAALVFAWALAASGQPLNAPMTGKDDIAADKRIENWTGKTIMVFTPHPDDDTFALGGVLALLAEKQNHIYIVIYTNDNKGSLDLDMTRERLARIRRAEEEEACRILGIPKENIIWLGYEDGDLEYADPRVLRGEVCRLIKKYRPNAVFAVDPGANWEQWHKTDHRMAAMITKDAFLAAQWHLYYPQHLLDEGLKPYETPVAYYYYSREPNYEVDISGKFDMKIKAAAAHVSQFEPSVSKYTPEMPKETFDKVREMLGEVSRGGKGYVERFRREEGP